MHQADPAPKSLFLETLEDAQAELAGDARGVPGGPRGEWGTTGQRSGHAPQERQRNSREDELGGLREGVPGASRDGAGESTVRWTEDEVAEDLEAGVGFFSNFFKAFLHPKSALFTDTGWWQGRADENLWPFWEAARLAGRDCLEEAEDRIRFFAEECDGMQVSFGTSLDIRPAHLMRLTTRTCCPRGKDRVPEEIASLFSDTAGSTLSCTTDSCSLVTYSAMNYNAHLVQCY